MFALIQSNFVGVAISLFLLLFILTNRNFETRINRLFCAAAFCVLILIVEEAWEAELACAAVYMPLRVPLSALGYSLRPMIPYFLILTLRRYRRRGMFLLTAPLIINALVAFSALFSNLAFSYTADNQFVRGPLGLTPFFVAGIYAVVLLVLTVQECWSVDLGEAMIVSAIALLAFSATVMESLFGFQFIQNPCIAVSITFYYLFLQSNRNNRDPLTGALTRRRFYLDAERRNTVLTAVISLDLNHLKELNDQRGHAEGDLALTTVSNTIKRHTGTRASLYRVGGDEFMMFCYRCNEETVKRMIGEVEAELEKTPYRCAIGYVMFHRGMTIDSACQMADEMMYQNKRRMKDAPPSNGTAYTP